MRRKIVFVFVSIMLVRIADAYVPVESSVVMDAKTGRFIYRYNEDVKTPPASLTKMMTLLLTFKALRQGKISLNSRLKVSKKASRQRPCTLGLKEGEVITVKDAILAVITKSANDVAVALGEFVGGNENTFVYMMNKEARRLGMSSTLFVNPSGWKNPRQLSTAKDLAKLARALVKEYPKYYHFFSTKTFSYNKACIRNHNKLLGTQEGMVIDGIKTGYLASSGYNLAASAKKGNNRLIVIVLGGKTARRRDTEVSLLLKRGFGRIYNKKAMSALIAQNSDHDARILKILQERRRNGKGKFNSAK